MGGEGIRRLEVEGSEAGERLDVVLARRLEGCSRTSLGGWIRAGRVRVEGALVAKPARPVRQGERIEVDVPPPEPPGYEPEAVPLEVLYEDHHVLAVNKPAGLVVHPAGKRRSGTLVNALLGRAHELAPSDDPRKPGIVHRLDKDTSGCLVVAKTPQARQALEAQFKGRQVTKVYLAVVGGSPPARGIIHEPVGRDRRHRRRMSVRSPRGKEARSRFRVLERFPGAALVEVRIETGRTHQIRVHMASMGHPILGDALYGGSRARLRRQALHARELRFRHPVGGGEITLVAPLPEDLEGLLAGLRGPDRPAPAGGGPGRGEGGPAEARVRDVLP